MCAAEWIALQQRIREGYATAQSLVWTRQGLQEHEDGRTAYPAQLTLGAPCLALLARVWLGDDVRLSSALL